MKFSYRWLQTYFSEPLPEPKKLADLLTFHSFEIESVSPEGDDWIFEIAILPNRRHDCLSHRGVAKEISVITEIPLARDPFLLEVPLWNTPAELSAAIGDTKGVPRYMAAYMRGVSVSESPDWLKERLRAVGQKPINNIVDATNYVMFELGQPLHAFDAERFEKEGKTVKIGARNARKGELVALLGGEERVLDAGDLVIVDGVSDSPIGIAGIKGGLACEITPQTKNIIIESANFDPVQIRKTATRLGLRTDASMRFESGLAPEQAEYALREVIMLIEKLTGATLLGVHDKGNWIKKEVVIPLSAVEVNKLLGTALNEGVLLDMLGALNFPYEKRGEEVIVTPPFERLDVLTKEDLIEEVGRVYGYEKIAALSLPKADKPPLKGRAHELQAAVNKNFYYAEKIRDVLVGLGFSEVYTHAIGEFGGIELENPLAEDKRFLRATLECGLRNCLLRGEAYSELLGLEQVKIFELGHIFSDIGEYTTLGIAVRNVKDDKNHDAEKELRGALDTLARELDAKEVAADGAGDFASRESFFQMPLKDFIEMLPEKREYEPYSKPAIEPRSHQISPYPFVLRDIAVFVPEGTLSDEVLAIIRNEAGKLLVRARLFDEFKKGGRISYAFRLVFQSHEKTLSDVEVNEIIERVTDALNKKNGFIVR